VSCFFTHSVVFVRFAFVSFLFTLFIRMVRLCYLKIIGEKNDISTSLLQAGLPELCKLSEYKTRGLHVP